VRSTSLSTLAHGTTNNSAPSHSLVPEAETLLFLAHAASSAAPQPDSEGTFAGRGGAMASGAASPQAPVRYGRVSVDDWSSARLCDVGNLLLGMILFFSPWLFGLSTGAQWQTASTVGILIAVLSVAALAAFAIWEEWLNLIVGLWLIASPWLLGFQGSSALAADVSLGAVVAVLANPVPTVPVSSALNVASTAVAALVTADRAALASHGPEL